MMTLVDNFEEVLAGKPTKGEKPEKSEKPEKDDGTQAVEDYHKFAKGWLERFDKFLKTQNIFTVIEKAKFRCKNLMSHVPAGKGNKKNL